MNGREEIKKKKEEAATAKGLKHLLIEMKIRTKP